MKKLRYLILLGIIFSILCLFGCAFWNNQEAIPEPGGFVNDFAGMISEEVEKSLGEMISQFEQKTTNEIAVVTVKTIGSQSIEDYTMELAEKWKVGKKDKDNGVIILIAKEEKKIRIEVGYGLEPVLTDSQAKMIIDREITPNFKNDDYDAGIQAGVKAVMAAIEGSYIPSDSENQSGGFPMWALILCIVFGTSLLVVIVAAVDSSSGGYWSSGGGGSRDSGFGGFGGGGFGGGGASGGW